MDRAFSLEGRRVPTVLSYDVVKCYLINRHTCRSPLEWTSGLCVVGLVWPINWILPTYLLSWCFLYFMGLKFIFSKEVQHCSWTIRTNQNNYMIQDTVPLMFFFLSSIVVIMENRGNTNKEDTSVKTFQTERETRVLSGYWSIELALWSADWSYGII